LHLITEQEQKDELSRPSRLYNQQYLPSCARKLALDLRAGVNHLQVTDITPYTSKPDSVDPAIPRPPAASSDSRAENRQ